MLPTQCGVWGEGVGATMVTWRVSLAKSRRAATTETATATTAKPEKTIS